MVDLTTVASTLDASVGSLTIGLADRGSTSDKNVTGMFNMGGGTLVATAITLGKDLSGGAAAIISGTLG